MTAYDAVLISFALVVLAVLYMAYREMHKS